MSDADRIEALHMEVAELQAVISDGHKEVDSLRLQLLDATTTYSEDIIERVVSCDNDMCTNESESMPFHDPRHKYERFQFLQLPKGEAFVCLDCSQFAKEEFEVVDEDGNSIPVINKNIWIKGVN